MTVQPPSVRDATANGWSAFASLSCRATSPWGSIRAKPTRQRGWKTMRTMAGSISWCGLPGLDSGDSPGVKSLGVNTVEVKTMGDVSLSVPAKPDFLHVVRAVVSGVGALQGLSYDAINELCVGACNAFSYLLGLPPADGDAVRGGRLSVRVRAENDIDITVMTDAVVPTWPPPAQRTLAWRILSGLVDDGSFVVEEGCPAIRLVLSGPARESATER